MAILGLALLVLAVVTELIAVGSERDIPELTDVLSVRIFPFPDRVAWFADHGMPDASAVDEAAAETPKVPGTAEYVNIDLQTTEFADLNSWIVSDGPSTYVLWLVEHPDYTFGAPFSRTPLTYNNANGDLGFYAAPSRVGTAGLDAVLFPRLPVELAFVAAGLVLVVWRRLLRQKELWVVAALGAFGPVSMLIAWQGESQEVTRHMVEGSVEARLAVLLFFLFALLLPRPVAEPGIRSSAALPGRQRDTAGQPERGPEPAHVAEASH